MQILALGSKGVSSRVEMKLSSSDLPSHNIFFITVGRYPGKPEKPLRQVIDDPLKTSPPPKMWSRVL